MINKQLLIISLLASPLLWAIYWRLNSSKKQKILLLIYSITFVSFINIRYTCVFIAMIFAVYYSNKLFFFIKNKKTVFQLTLSLLVINLIIHKSLIRFNYTVFLNNDFSQIIWPLGISYVTFRLIHYAVEVYRGTIAGKSIVDFALYILFFPTFLAGPLERYNNFNSQHTGTSVFNAAEINSGLFRIARGIIKKFYIADTLIYILKPVIENPQNYAKFPLILSVYGIALVLYLDFSGYTDIAIGISRLFGYKISENFKAPFFKKNIILFWRNWHITVYTWIRDYFFLPIFGYRATKIKMYAGIISTMLLLNLWHSLSWNFFLLGIYHSIGVIICYAFSEIRKRSPVISHWAAKKYLLPASILLTFSFYSFGTILLMDLNKALSFIKHFF